jgi:hypothetical protein
MTRHLYIDQEPDGPYTVRVLVSARGDRTHQFTTHAQAMAITAKKMGRNDFVLDATPMSGEQLRQHRLHLARLCKLDDLIAKRCR